MNVSPRLRPAFPRLMRGLGDLAPDYDVILCDVWGVIHNGAVHFPDAVDALARFRAGGGTVILITNAPRLRRNVSAFLDGLCVPHAAYDGVVTSGDVTVSLILERGESPLAHIGPADDMSLFLEAERLAGKPLRLTTLEEAAYVVCIGPTNAATETPHDYQAQLALMLSRGMDFICANPDIVVQMGEKLVYCAGALAEAYAAIGGTVVQAGKPHPPIYERALAFAARLRDRSIDPSCVLAIGDAMQTDIRGAQRQALATLFVTNGIHRSELHTKGGALDPDSLRQFVANLGFAPMAAIPALVW